MPGSDALPGLGAASFLKFSGTTIDGTGQAADSYATPVLDLPGAGVFSYELGAPGTFVSFNAVVIDYPIVDPAAEITLTLFVNAVPVATIGPLTAAGSASAAPFVAPFNANDNVLVNVTSNNATIIFSASVGLLG